MNEIIRNITPKESSNLPDPVSVVKVDGGRGFVITHRVKIPLPTRKKFRVRGPKTASFCDYRLVVTAAHCSPQLPPANASSYLEERTYGSLLSALSDQKTNISAECLFVNPVADIAVLGCPDDQELSDEAEQYDAFIEGIQPVQIDNPRSGPGWVLSLDRQWVHTTLEVFRGLKGVRLSIDPTDPGMSGSPILNNSGRAVGIVVVGSETASSEGNRENERAGGQAILTRDFPGWLLP